MLSALALALATQTAPPMATDARLTVCLEAARNDPATAIAQAGEWLGETGSTGVASAEQCLGTAYTRLLKWEASEEAFVRAREAVPEVLHLRRSRLAAMAGSAALAGGRPEAALVHFDTALADGEATGLDGMTGMISVDRSRALVALDREEEAAVALERARREAPQDPQAWLLSATLARRADDLLAAQSYIQTSSALDPDDPEIGLEAGVIAVLSGREEAARQSWQSVLITARGTKIAQTAESYLAQLGDAPVATSQQETGR
ncbi:hypothetical protein [Altererythrobacter sp. ZODW24]|uniref:tetratricopeptide repeat protein n=1 Tax=Altererythrobacter sp. ZODW24 TaxID=2185142 RepID=UPI0013B40981|nr:hypothetical protein [Altererythrobacter sp. ZODW24]